MKRIIGIVLLLSAVFMSCNNQTKKETKPVQLITLDPGHFHAALVQKTMYNDVDSVVHVYAPEGNDLQLHLDRIKGFNTRANDPTHWKEQVYAGNDFFEKMLAEKKGNVVVLAGNNQKKAEYILKSLDAGFNVLADKPMAINRKGFETLKKAFETAKEKNLLLYDIMTERFEITAILQRELSMMPEIFGTLEKGSPENPAVVIKSVHFLYKYVSGNVLTRPAWFLDISQQGEGIVDVMTHLVDLVQWESFPGTAIDFEKDIQVDSARHWSTNISLSEFKTLTKLDSFPSYFNKIDKADTSLQVYCNGEINYRIRGIYTKTMVEWNYKAPDGTGDSQYSLMRGTKANLIVRQGAAEQYKPTLYIEPRDSNKNDDLTGQIKNIQAKYPGVELKRMDKGWVVIIPEKYKEDHEAHFARVTQNFLNYLRNKNMPAWEVPNMIAKYFVTTKGLEMSLKNK
jgi:predicted dehydrogenase